MILNMTRSLKSHFSLGYFLLIVLTIILNLSIYHFYYSSSSSTCSSSCSANDQFAKSVFMTQEEREIIRSYLKPTHRMLEYGSGYSTLYFSQFVRAYYSIEHDHRWYKNVKKLIAKNPLVSAKVIKYLLVPVDEGHKGWPGGFDEGTREQFDEYIQGVHKLGVTHFDVVLIDGRARVECAKEIVRYLHKDSIVFIHDYTHREHYSNISKENYRFVLNTYKDQSLVAFKLVR